MEDEIIESKLLTQWGHPDDRLESQFGFGQDKVTYREWCELESKRQNENGADTKVITNARGQVCVTKN